MTPGTTVSRESIIDVLKEALRPLPFVRAFYEGGSAAFGRVDAWSDIDLYVIADDTATPETFAAAEETLKSLSPIRVRHEVSWPPASGIDQRFYLLERTSRYLVVDLAVLKESAPDKFLTREIHGDAVVYFDKDGVARPPPLDEEAFVRGLLARRTRLVEQMEVFGPFVEKEILRGNWLEALEFYRGLVLRFLVEALRMNHGPIHFDFRWRSIHRELPPEMVRRLEDLAFVRDPEDLAAKVPQALAWFREAIHEVDEERVRRQTAGD